ncbi:MAG: hypothetical protein ABR962_01415 [Candidatus Bathyarchaeia archaeon]|jgi:Rad3-related DNA helicase
MPLLQKRPREKKPVLSSPTAHRFSTEQRIRNLENLQKQRLLPLRTHEGLPSRRERDRTKLPHVFEPTIRTAFLKSLDAPLSKTILIIDEAHNLPETAVGIASSSLTLFAVKQAQAEAREFKYRDIETFARTIHNEIVTMAKRIQKETRIAPETLVELAQEKGTIDTPRDSSNIFAQLETPLNETCSLMENLHAPSSTR